MNLKTRSIFFFLNAIGLQQNRFISCSTSDSGYISVSFFSETVVWVPLKQTLTV